MSFIIAIELPGVLQKQNHAPYFPMRQNTAAEAFASLRDNKR